MQGCLGRIVQAHQGQTVVLVVHGGVVEAAFAYFVGQGLKLFEGGHPAAGHTSLTLWRQAQPQGGYRNLPMTPAICAAPRGHKIGHHESPP